MVCLSAENHGLESNQLCKLKMFQLMRFSWAFQEQSGDLEAGENSPRDSLITQHLLKAQEEAKKVADNNRAQIR